MSFCGALVDDASLKAFLASPAPRGSVALLGPSVAASHAGALRAHGLGHAVVELHGPVPEAHAIIPRSAFVDAPVPPLESVVATLAHARSQGLPTVVVTRVSRSGARVLRELGAMIARLGVARWIVILPWAAPALEPPQLPRAALTMPFVLEAAKRTSDGGTPTVIVGAPLCLVGPLALLAHPAPGAAGTPCDGCAAARVCPGLGERYLSTFGSSELRSLGAAPVTEPDALTTTILAARR